jgi:hypothetical protein
MGKANVVADVRSRKVRKTALRLVQTPELEDYVIEKRIKMTNIRVQPEWLH